VYLLHGEFTDEEMNSIYNHSKVKAMISLTKGEGFGRPLLEFTQSKKPIICSEWGGQSDFLHKDKSLLIPGNLTPVHKSALMKDIIIENSQWFTVDYDYVLRTLKDVFENYKNYKPLGKKLAYHCQQNFSYDVMKVKLKNTIEDNIEMPYQLKLPRLSKVN
jgi:glycosyltransferase involved in cell wall biosynthesis